MGLASSQARLLSLTSRMHQIEYKAAKLEAQKLQMANESEQVYETYLNTLEATKIQRKFLTTDGSVSYKDIDNYKEDFLNQNFAIAFNNELYSEDAKYDKENDRFFTIDSPEIINIDTAAKRDEMRLETGDNTIAVNDTVYKYIPLRAGENVYSKNQELPNVVAVDAFAVLTHDAFDADPTNPPTNVKDVITNLINSGQCVIVTKKPEESWQDVSLNDPAYLTSVATNTNLQEVNDETNLRKAEAKYEADMKKIDRKERYYDQQLSAIEQERNAIKTEMDTLKTVAKDNVERTFKLFG